MSPLTLALQTWILASLFAAPGRALFRTAACALSGHGCALPTWVEP